MEPVEELAVEGGDEYFYLKLVEILNLRKLVQCLSEQLLPILLIDLRNISQKRK